MSWIARGCWWLGWLAVCLMALPGFTRAAVAADHQPRESTVEPMVVGCEIDYLPFAGVDETGQPIGFTVDLMNAIADEMALPITWRTGTWPEIRSAFEAGEIDVLPNMAVSPERREHAQFSVPHVVVHGALFTRVGSPPVTDPTDMAAMHLLVMEGDIAHDYLQQAGWDQHVTTTATISEALQRLAAGEGDGVVAGRLQGQVCIHELGLSNIQVQAVSQVSFQQRFAIAVHRDDNALLAVLNEGLAITKANGTYDRLYEAWFGVYEAPDPAEVRRNVWLIVGIIFGALALLAIIVVMFSAVQRVLRRTIEYRTRELNALRTLYEQTLEHQVGMTFRFTKIGDRFVHTLCRGQLLAKFGLTPAQVEGKELHEFFPAPIAEAKTAWYQRAWDGEQVSYEGTNANGSVVYTAHLRRMRVGERYEVIASCVEITDRVGMERRLRDTAHQAESASQAKSEFLARMSHEIRTPMVGVLGMAEHLLDALPPGEHQAAAGTILRSGRSLLQMLDDVLDLSKIEAGTMTIDAKPTRLPGLVNEVADLFQRRCQELGLRIETSVEAGLPEVVMVDGLRLRQVLMNLVANAVKFTAQGSIRVDVRGLEAPRADRVRLGFDVTDTGIGIPPDLVPKLFEPFTASHRAGLSNEGGTGLGLGICKRLVERMDGEINVTSTEGQGSRFTVSLSVDVPPAGQDHEDRPAPPEPGTKTWRALNSLRVLVAEDNEINRLVLSRHLGSLGLQPIMVEHGQAAIVAIATANDAVDLVFMDLQMPIMDGYEATRRLRARPELASLRIIALTAHALEEERQRCLASGFDDFLVKPVDKATLLEVLTHSVHIDGAIADDDATRAASDNKASRSGPVG